MHRPTTLLLLLLSTPTTPAATPTATPTATPADPSRTTYSCGAQLRLPAAKANFTAGALPEPPTPLESLGFDFVQHMLLGGGDASGGAMSAIFHNFRRGTLDKYWQDGTEPGQFAGSISPWGNTATSTYAGHAFAIVDRATQQRITLITMRSDTTLYIIGPPLAAATSVCALDTATFGHSQALTRALHLSRHSSEPEAHDSETKTSSAYLNVLAQQQRQRDYYAQRGTHWLSAGELARRTLRRDARRPSAAPTSSARHCMCASARSASPTRWWRSRCARRRPRRPRSSRCRCARSTSR